MILYLNCMFPDNGRFISMYLMILNIVPSCKCMVNFIMEFALEIAVKEMCIN